MRTACPNCSTRLKSDVIAPGSRVMCPRCRTDFVAQELASPPAPATPSPLPASPILAQSPIMPPIAPNPLPAGPSYPETSPEEERSGISMEVWVLGGMGILLTLGVVLVIVLLVNNSSSDPVVEGNLERRGREDRAIRKDRAIPQGKEKLERAILEPHLQINEPIERKREDIGGNKGGRIPVFIKVEFLGTKGGGSRFAIIADRSGSMMSPYMVTDPDTGRRMNKSAITLLHEEMINTLRSFKKDTLFYISFYSSRSYPMAFGDNWMEGKDVEKVIPWINANRPTGGTNPLGSFQKVFSLNPPPDVIFFMTDGQFGINTELIKRMNKGPRKAVINTIQFRNNFNVPPVNGRFNRYARLLATYRFPDMVCQRLESQIQGRGGIRFRTQQMEQIARDSGGVFCYYPPKPPTKQQQPLPQGKKEPVFVRMDEIKRTDPTYPLRRNHYHKSYRVQLQAGKTYQIDMVSAFDNYLFLEDNTGQVVTRNDDGGVGLNAMITYTPPRSDSYRVIATTFGSGRTGTFVLSVVEGIVR